MKTKFYLGGTLTELREVEASGMLIPDSAQKLKISDTLKNLGSLGKEQKFLNECKIAKKYFYFYYYLK